MPEETEYDSTVETLAHINLVQSYMVKMVSDLLERARAHDASKLLSPEKEMYDQFTPRLRESTYGSPEYTAMLVAMGPGLQEHYRQNRHHAEHFENGVNGMNLLDLLEMLADWKAASQRHDDGDLRKSFAINVRRFEISAQLAQIIENTINDLAL